MEVKVQNEPWCERCPFVDLVVEKQFSYCEGEIADMSLTAYCSSLDQCREAVARAKALEEQSLAKWWEGMRVAPCGQKEQKNGAAHAGGQAAGV